MLTVAAIIWIGIKLPQEWWIHIAKLDVTDVIGDAAGFVVPNRAVLSWWFAGTGDRVSSTLYPNPIGRSASTSMHIRRRCSASQLTLHWDGGH